MGEVWRGGVGGGGWLAIAACRFFNVGFFLLCVSFFSYFFFFAFAFCLMDYFFGLVCFFLERCDYEISKKLYENKYPTYVITYIL